MEDLAPPRGLGRDALVPLFGVAPPLAAIKVWRKHERQAARPPSSCLSPLATIFSELSGSGLCSLSASSAGAFIQTSISSRAVRTTGIAFGWITPTSLFGSVVRNAKMSFVVSPSFTFRTEVQRVQMPAKKANGRVSSKANQTGGRVPSGSTSFSEKLVHGAASYEAREFGVHSAMPSVTAKRKCPNLIFVKPRFDVYKAVSLQIRAIFAAYTPIIEPLSLDEAYLDVTENLKGIVSATQIAETIRAKIRTETGLTASAGVSYNKFLAKLASDHRKPDGLFVITPKMGQAFVLLGCAWHR